MHQAAAAQDTFVYNIIPRDKRKEKSARTNLFPSRIITRKRKSNHLVNVLMSEMGKMKCAVSPVNVDDDMGKGEFFFFACRSFYPTNERRFFSLIFGK